MSKILFASSVAMSMLSGICFAADTGSGGGISSEDRKTRIRAAVEKLDHKSDDDWTQGGLPAVDRVKATSGMDDISRQDISDAHPGYARQKPDDDADGQPNSDGQRAAEGDEAAPLSELEEAEQRIKPNMPAEENPNVGRDDLGPYEGQAHTADQTQNLQAQLCTDERDRMPTAAEIAERITDPVLLIEAAVAAMNASDRYRKNGELQTFLRDYSIRQVNIKAHQGRLDKRWDEAEKQAR